MHGPRGSHIWGRARGSPDMSLILHYVLAFSYFLLTQAVDRRVRIRLLSSSKCLFMRPTSIWGSVDGRQDLWSLDIIRGGCFGLRLSFVSVREVNIGQLRFPNCE